MNSKYKTHDKKIKISNEMQGMYALIAQAGSESGVQFEAHFALIFQYN